MQKVDRSFFLSLLKIHPNKIETAEKCPLTCSTCNSTDVPAEACISVNTDDDELIGVDSTCGKQGKGDVLIERVSWNGRYLLAHHIFSFVATTNIHMQQTNKAGDRGFYQIHNTLVHCMKQWTKHAHFRAPGTVVALR